MVRFGTIISIDEQSASAIIRDNTPAAREFLMPREEVLRVLNETAKLKRRKMLFAQVSFLKDDDYKSTDVAQLVKFHRAA